MVGARHSRQGARAGLVHKARRQGWEQGPTAAALFAKTLGPAPGEASTKDDPVGQAGEGHISVCLKVVTR